MRKRIGITLTLDKQNKIYTTPHTSLNKLKKCAVSSFGRNWQDWLSHQDLQTGAPHPCWRNSEAEKPHQAYIHIYFSNVQRWIEVIRSTINSNFSLSIPKPFCVQYLGDIPDEVEKTDICLFKILQISSGTKRIHLLYEKERMVSNTNKFHRNGKTHICTMTAKTNIWEKMEKAE